MGLIWAESARFLLPGASGHREKGDERYKDTQLKTHKASVVHLAWMHNSSLNFTHITQPL